MKPTISVSAKRIFWLLLSVTLLLAALCAAVVLYKTVPGVAESRMFSNNPNLGSLNLFDLKREESIGTWYSSSLLLLCSAISAIISFSRKSEGQRYVNHWRVLSVVFLYLSVDEASTLHEKMGPFGRQMLRTLDLQISGFNRAWVIPAAALLFVFALSYLRFFFNLPAKQRLLFLISAVFYLGGAIGLEVLHGFLTSSSGGRQSLTELLLPVGEESLEMLGLTVFVYALLSYLGSFQETTFRVEGEKPG